MSKTTRVQPHKRTTPTGKITDVRSHWRRIRGMRAEASLLKSDEVDKHYLDGLDGAQATVDEGAVADIDGTILKWATAELM